MTARQPAADRTQPAPPAPGRTWRAALAVLSGLRGRLRADGSRRPQVRVLSRDELIRVEPGRVPLAIACRRGTCLLTQAGDPEDHVLLAGDRFRPARRGLVVVWAFTDAEVEL